MFRWIAALVVAALLTVPGLAQQDDPLLPPETESDAPPTFEPLFMLDEDGRLILIGAHGEAELDVLSPGPLDQVWRSRLSRKIEMLIRAGAQVDEATYRWLLRARPADREHAEHDHPVGAGAHRRSHHRPHARRWAHRLRQHHARRMLEHLGFKGEEQRAIRPLLDAVLRARRDLGVTEWRGRRKLRRAAPTEDAAARALLTAFRQDRAGKRARLSAARQRLREVVTVKQEALLVVQGVLD